MMKKKYIVWWSIPFILLYSIAVDRSYIDVMFPLTFFTGIICFVLLIMGFVYRELEIKRTGNTLLERILVNLFLFYSILYPFVFVFASSRIGQVINWSSFIKFNYSFKLFLFIQIIPILILLMISIRERKNWK